MSRRSEGLLTVLAVLVCALVTGVFFSRFTAAGLVLERIFESAAGALLAAAASVACGAVCIRGAVALLARTGADGAVAESDVPEELLIGSALYGSLLALVAWAGFLSQSVLVALSLVIGAAGIAMRWRSAAALFRTVEVRTAAILLPPVVIAFVTAIAPVNSPDELVYKLAVPRSWMLFGKMVELPLCSNSYYPNSINVTDLTAMLAGDSGARLFHFLLYLAALRAIVRISSRLAGSPTVWPAAVLAWTPALAIIAGWAWAEWALIGLAILSLDRFHAFLTTSRGSDLAAAALALGAAASAKYTALPWIAVLVPIALWRLRGRWSLLATAAALVALAGGLFYVRNAVWTGSPFAPFLLDESPGVTNYRSGLGGWTELALGFDVFHPGIIDDSLAILLPAMVLLAPLALIGASALAVDLFAIGLVQFVFLVPLAPTARLISLAIVPLAIVGAVATRRLWLGATRTIRLAFSTLFGLALFGQLLLVLYVFATQWQFVPVLVGAETEEAYLSRTRDYHQAYGWIAAHTPADAKLLLLGENRTFHLERRAIAAGNLDSPRVAAWLSSFPTPEAFGAALRAEGFGYVLVHKPWYRVAKPDAPLRMLEKEYVLAVPAATDDIVRGYLLRNARVAYSDPAYVLFQLP